MQFVIMYTSCPGRVNHKNDLLHLCIKCLCHLSTKYNNDIICNQYGNHLDKKK